MRLQHITLNSGEAVSFYDLRETHISARCQPRDLVILEGPDTPRVREEIAVDIRIGQGIAPIGAARGLLHS